MVAGPDILRGQVASLRLIRDSWGIAQVHAGSASETSTLVGTLLGFDVGDTIEAEGVWAKHPSFGDQFKARAVRVLVPTDASGAIAWLMARMPAIGRRLATEMVERWGLPGVWELLEQRPHELAELRGITPARAAAIGEAYQAHRGERDRMVALKKWQLTDHQIGKLVTAWGSDVLTKLREDPYAAIEHVDGFGWARADDLARRRGLPPAHPSRIRAALLHLLEEAACAGHCYVPLGKLVSMARALLEREVDVSEEAIRREGRALLEAGKLVVTGPGRVYAAEVARAEEGVAASVLRLLRGEGGAGAEGSKAA
jgi:exodeoxyribonuclease V alpha subunit